MSCRKRLLIGALAILLLHSFALAKINVKLVDVSLEDFIKVIAVRTSTNIVYSKRDIPSSVKINLYTPEGLTEEELFNIFQSILKANGLVALRKGNSIVILKAVEVRRLTSDVWPKGLSHSLVTSVIKLNNVNAYEAIKPVKHLLSNIGRVDVVKAMNALVVTDVKEVVGKVRNFLRQIDVAETMEFKTYHLDDVDSNQVASELKSFFTELARKRPGFEVPVVVAESTTNSLMVAAKKEDMGYVDEVVRDVVERAKRVGAQKVIYLKNAVAKNVYKVVADLVAKDKSLRGVSVAFDEPTNSIILTGKQALFSKVEKLIQKLDVTRKQVYIEALVIETTVSKLQEFGVEWSAFAKASGGVGYVGTTTSGNLGAIQGSILGKGEFTALPGGFTLGVLGDTITYNGIKFATLGALLNALKTDSGINIVSNPKIVTLDNQQATIFCGRK